jgi:hypothetical protein
VGEDTGDEGCEYQKKEEATGKGRQRQGSSRDDTKQEEGSGQGSGQEKG